MNNLFTQISWTLFPHWSFSTSLKCFLKNHREQKTATLMMQAYCFPISIYLLWNMIFRGVFVAAKAWKNHKKLNSFWNTINRIKVLLDNNLLQNQLMIKVNFDALITMKGMTKCDEKLMISLYDVSPAYRSENPTIAHSRIIFHYIVVKIPIDPIARKWKS